MGMFRNLFWALDDVLEEPQDRNQFGTSCKDFFVKGRGGENKSRRRFSVLKTMYIPFQGMLPVLTKGP